MNTGNDILHYQKKEFSGRTLTVSYLILAAGVILVAGSYLIDSTRAGYNMLLVLTFILSVGIGCLFLVALEYVSGAVWSVPFRRISEFLSLLIVVSLLLMVPVFLQSGILFEWMNPGAVRESPVLASKSAWLNETFFILRSVAIMIIWLIFYLFIVKNSITQDKTAEQKLTRRNIAWSAAFIPIFGLTLTIISFDYLMSLEPEWYSTIFGVYYFSGSVLAALAVTTLFAVYLHERGYLPQLKRDHFYSLGALMFAFINFWAYIAFSQFMLIWYGNLPEETVWFLHRSEGSWIYVSIGLIFIQFIIPYSLLLSQPSKSSPKMLKFASAWIIFAHLYDLYFMVMPVYSKTGANFGWMELIFILFISGLILAAFFTGARRFNLIPTGDPKLKRAADFEL